MNPTSTTNAQNVPANEVVQDALQSTKLALRAGERAIEDISHMQQRMERNLDWRAQVRDRPWVALGIAALGGLLLARIVGGRD
jgi:ElaB/YqjD/DUF883 family membrane-anchored ribosome-binding protein